LKEFARLFSDLDQTNKTNEKLELLRDYFRSTTDQNKLWALSLFTGKKPKRQINSTLLRAWIAEATGISDWLFVESYLVVGDFAETAALLLEEKEISDDCDLGYWFTFLNKLPELPEWERKERIITALQGMNYWEKLVFIKLITGSFRIGISSNLVIRAIADVMEMEPSVAAHRLMGKWTPENTSFQDLLRNEDQKDDLSRPYPFCLAHALDDTPATLGKPEEWLAEWKWDGIRAQLIWRKNQLFIWSRGEDLVTDKFPELHIIKNQIESDIVLDGEILAFNEGNPMPFGVLQTRIGRKNVSKTFLKNAPVIFMLYDILELDSADLRENPISYRRSLLKQIADQINQKHIFMISPEVEFHNWEELEEKWQKSREFYSEGLMLKKKDSPYMSGRKKGYWWKWKISPLSIDGVLINAQKGHGRRADLYSDYTFGVWDQGKLVPFAKAYSGLTDQELQQVDSYIKKNILEKFGPVRTVKPGLVFEIGFEGIQESKRHKSGVALRFPRILRWRTDKKAEEADTLENLKMILTFYSKSGG
jgi:DNA ligase 1